jgi:hypothetical protein
MTRREHEVAEKAITDYIRIALKDTVLSIIKEKLVWIYVLIGIMITLTIGMIFMLIVINTALENTSQSIKLLVKPDSVAVIEKFKNNENR